MYSCWNWVIMGRIPISFTITPGFHRGKQSQWMGRWDLSWEMLFRTAADLTGVCSGEEFPTKDGESLLQLTIAGSHQSIDSSNAVRASYDSCVLRPVQILDDQLVDESNHVWVKLGFPCSPESIGSIIFMVISSHWNWLAINTFFSLIHTACFFAWAP